jgi:tetratricopeptide (TPR) repeat protein
VFGAALLTIAPGAGLATAAEGWTRLETPSFTFFSNASDKVTRHYAGELEAFRHFVARALGDGAVASPLPTLVYLFDSAETFDGFSLGERNVGWLISTRQANVIALDTSSVAGTEVAYHEYLHFVVENSTPAVPLWLNEGLAEFYTTFRRGPDKLEVGRPVERHVEFLRRNRLISFDDLFAVTRKSPEYTEQRRRGVFYAQSWAFVHYLLVGQSEFRIEVDDFLDRLRDGQAADAAYRDAFGTSAVGLRRELEHYIGQARFEYLLASAPAGPGARLARPESLSEAEASARLGLLRLASNSGAEDAAAYDFGRALALDADNATALRGMGELDLRRGDYQQAVAWFAQALVDSAGDVSTLDLNGLALLQVVESRLDGPGGLDDAQRELVDEARSSFAQALALDPSFAPALSGYGRTFFWDADPGVGIEFSGRAVRLLPRNAVILSTHLALVAQAGEMVQARQVYDWLHRPAVRPTAKNLSGAERALFNAEFQHLVRTHTESGQYPALLAGLDALVGRAPDALLQIELEEQIEQLREVVDRNRWADAFNRALDLWKTGQEQAAIELLREVAAETNDGHLVDEAERVLESLLASAANERR